MKYKKMTPYIKIRSVIITLILLRKVNFHAHINITMETKYHKFAYEYMYSIFHNRVVLHDH